MNSMGRRARVGFGLMAAGALIGAVPLGFGDLLPTARPWFPIAVAAFVVAGSACLFFSRPDSHASILAKASRDIVAALERHNDELKHLATLSEQVGGSLERVAEQVGDVGSRLDHLGNRLERLATETADAGQQPEPTPSDPPSGTAATTPHPDLGQELKRAWERYRDGGDGHFNAEGFTAELAKAGIDADVRGLDGEAGRAVLAIVDPDAGDRSFFVVPDFSKSPKSAQHWFKDESSGTLGGRTDELRTLARGRWSENGSEEVVDMGTVA